MPPDNGSSCPSSWVRPSNGGCHVSSRQAARAAVGVAGKAQAAARVVLRHLLYRGRGRQLRPAAGRQRRARRVYLGARIDVLLATVRQVVHEAAHQHVSRAGVGTPPAAAARTCAAYQAPCQTPCQTPCQSQPPPPQARPPLQRPSVAPPASVAPCLRSSRTTALPLRSTHQVLGKLARPRPCTRRCGAYALVLPSACLRRVHVSTESQVDTIILTDPTRLKMTWLDAYPLYSFVPLILVGVFERIRTPTPRHRERDPAASASTHAGSASMSMR